MTLTTSLANILIIDDDQSLVDLLRLNLSCEGYNVAHVPRTSEVVEDDLRNVHLVLVDASNQDYTGLDFISDTRITPAGSSLGMIYYSEYDSERTLIDALDAGADDCLRKPFSLREMLARIRAVLRRRGRRAAAAVTDANVVTFKNLKVDLARRTASVDGSSVALSSTEFAILEILLKNTDSYTPRIEIFRTVWHEGNGANERIVDTNISRLRKKLGSVGTCIVNRSGMGYMLSK